MSENESTKNTPQICQEAADLFEIVNQFNYRLQKWMLDTGCGAEIRWNYNPELSAEVRLVVSMKAARIEKVLYSARPDDDAIQQMIAMQREKYDEIMTKYEENEIKPPK